MRIWNEPYEMLWRDPRDEFTPEQQAEALLELNLLEDYDSPTHPGITASDLFGVSDTSNSRDISESTGER